MNEFNFKLLTEYNLYDIYASSNNLYTDYVLSIGGTLYYKRVERLKDLELIELVTTLYWPVRYTERKGALNRIVDYFINDKPPLDKDEYNEIYRYDNYYTLYGSNRMVVDYTKIYVELEGGGNYIRLLDYETFEDLMYLIECDDNEMIECLIDL